MFKAIKLKWAKKLLGAKYFVVLTDKESVIALDGVNPEKMNDLLALAAQTAALNSFYERLAGLIKQHDQAATKLAIKATGDVGAKRRTRKTKTTTTSRKPKAKKITVREG